MAKLIDAIHILRGSNITDERLQEAHQLLNSFADDFEVLYGESNMVYNVHLLRHLTDCVKFIGPLSCYSNYIFEDFIGHLISLHKGTTDVTSQICQKYLLEKNLFYHLDRSSIARSYYDKINSKHKFSSCHKVAGSLVMGNKNQGLSDEEKSLILSSLNVVNGTEIREFESMLLNNSVYYEIFNKSSHKRTNDSFIFNAESKNFATIESIFVVDENLYILAIEKFEQVFDTANKCKFSIFLKESNVSRKQIWNASCVGPKFALIQFNNTIACSKFPNMYERN